MDFTFSASAVETYRTCPRKYFFNYVKGLRQPAGAGANLGTQIHLEIEGWLRDKKPPENAKAKALVSILPMPSPLLLLESEFETLYPVGRARGRIDLIIKDPLSPDLKIPEGFPAFGGPMCRDHKSTADIEEYAKKEAKDLYDDPQAALYGVETRLKVASKVTDVPEIDFCLGYTQTRGPAKTHVTHLRQTLSILEDSLGHVLDDAKKMSGLYVLQESDVPYESSGCGAYGGCPHRTYCTAPTMAPGTMLDFLPSVPVAPETQPTTTAGKEKKMTETALQRVKRINAENAAKRAASAPPSEPTATPAVVKASPEPEMPKFDTSKATAASPVKPPDAGPNLTEENAPQPPEEKPKRGKKAAASSSDPELKAILSQRAQVALSSSDFGKVIALAQALQSLETL